MGVDPRYEQRETDEAAREAAQVGGRIPHDEHDSAWRAVEEAGGGESEGFELTERALINNASHGDQQSAHAILHDQGRREQMNTRRADGEADYERSSEIKVD